MPSVILVTPVVATMDHAVHYRPAVPFIPVLDHAAVSFFGSLPRE